MTAHTEEDRDALLAAGTIADTVKIMLTENWPRIVEASEEGEAPVAKIAVNLAISTTGVNRQHIVKMRIPRKAYSDERATVADSEMPYLDVSKEVDGGDDEETEDGLP